MTIMHTVICMSCVYLFISYFFNQSGKCGARNAAWINLVLLGCEILQLFYFLLGLEC